MGELIERALNPAKLEAHCKISRVGSILCTTCGARQCNLKNIVTLSKVGKIDYKFRVRGI